MAHLIVPILVALSVGCAAWGITAAIAGSAAADRRRIARRLSTDGGGYSDSVGDALSVRADQQYIPPFLDRFSTTHRLRNRVQQTFPGLKLSRFLLTLVGTAVGFGALTWFVSGSMAAAHVAAVVAGSVPMVVLQQKYGRRQRTMEGQLPDALDFLSRVLKAGHSLTIGLQMMGDELPAPLGGEFRRCYDQHSLGQPLERCLREMAERIESTEFAFFVTAILIQRGTGGDLSEVLQNIGGMMRARARLQSHVKAKTAEGRFTGYILVVFPALMFVLTFYLNPDYGNTLLNSDTGRAMLGLALVLQTAGLVAIRKITSVKA